MQHSITRELVLATGTSSVDAPFCNVFFCAVPFLFASREHLRGQPCAWAGRTRAGVRYTGRAGGGIPITNVVAGRMDGAELVSVGIPPAWRHSGSWIGYAGCITHSRVSPSFSVRFFLQVSELVSSRLPSLPSRFRDCLLVPAPQRSLQRHRACKAFSSTRMYIRVL